MLMNLTDIFYTEGKVLQSSEPMHLDTVTIYGESHQILDATPVNYLFKNEGKGVVSVQIKTSFTLLLACDRCLKEVRYPMKIDSTTRVYAPEKKLPDSEEDENCFMDGYQLKVDDLLLSNIVLNWPMKILCREDCKGICKICGKDLNTGSCDCDTFVPNPALAGIKEIFNANKEV